jgi:hypothetical protein
MGAKISGVWAGLPACGLGFRRVGWASGVWAGLPACGLGFRRVGWASGVWVWAGSPPIFGSVKRMDGI